MARSQCRTLLTIEFPPTIPLPRFRLFQRVQFDDCPDCEDCPDCNLVGEIVGMEYITPDACKIEDFKGEGWTYRIKIDASGNHNPAGAHVFAWEDNVELLQEQ